MSVETYLVCNAKPLDDLEQSLPQSNTVMGTVHLCKPKQRRFHLPHAGGGFLRPRSSDREVRVCVGRLPCIACQIDSSFDGITLQTSQLYLE